MAVTKTLQFLAPFAIAMCLAACGARASRPTVPVETQNAVLSHYLRGDSFEKIAIDFRLADRDEARQVVHDAIIAVTRRYYSNR